MIRSRPLIGEPPATPQAALERSFLIKSGLANMCIYLFCNNKKTHTVNGFCDKMASYFLICLSQVGLASHREAWPLTGRLGL